LNPIQDNSGTKISLFPNPATSQITLDYNLEEMGEISISILDVFGKTVLNLLSNKQQESGHYYDSYSINELSSGIYIFTYRNRNYIETKRMVLIK
jgi:hypothetical protein